MLMLGEFNPICGGRGQQLLCHILLVALVGYSALQYLRFEITKATHHAGWACGQMGPPLAGHFSSDILTLLLIGAAFTLLLSLHTRMLAMVARQRRG
jgi:hypothetical protein